MKRMYTAWVLLLCIALSACGKSSAMSKEEADRIFGWGNAASGDAASVEIAATESTVPKTTAAAEVQMPETVPIVTMPNGSIPAVTEPYAGEVATGYGKSVNYSIPIANPDKDVYYSPNGQFMKDYGARCYDTIVEEYTDSQGVLWGRLISGGWTSVYNQILPDITLYAGGTKGTWSASFSLTGNGAFSGNNANYTSSTVKTCTFSGRFKVTNIENNIIYLEKTSLSREKTVGKTWTSGGVGYKADDAYCLDEGTQFILYTPSTPTYLVSYDVTQWFSSGSTLGMYVLYCPASGNSFFGSLDFLY